MGVMVHVSVGRLPLICNVQVWFSNPDKEDRLLETVCWTSEERRRRGDTMRTLSETE